jgi:hypothetical protein
MIFARIYLDDSDLANGAMEFAIGSHEQGHVAAGDAARIAAKSKIEVEDARRSDVLFLKALTLHRSGHSAKGSPRRVLRVDFAVREELADDLEWALPG